MCLDVNQGVKNCNCCTQIVILHAQTYWWILTAQQKLGQCDLLYGSKSPAEKTKHEQACLSYYTHSIGTVVLWRAGMLVLQFSLFHPEGLTHYTDSHISNQAARHSMSADLYFTMESFFLFCRLISELAERNSTIFGQVVGSKCNLKTHVGNLGYPIPVQTGRHKTTFLDDFATQRQI